MEHNNSHQCVSIQTLACLPHLLCDLRAGHLTHARCLGYITSGLRCPELQALDDEEVFLNIDLMHMYDYDGDLYNQLVAYPGEVIPLLDAEARYIAEDLTGEELTDDRLLTVRSCNLRN